MQASDCSLLSLLDGTRQFIIPIYQRNYSWSFKQCDQLLNDIIKVGNNQNINTHFMGGVVYIDESLNTVNEVRKLLIIDGQQRLTTCSLILFALAKRFFEYGDEKQHNKIMQRYLLNSEEENDLKYKLLPPSPDREAYISTIEGIVIDDVNNYSRIDDNYKRFYDQINVTNIDVIYNGVSKLHIINIVLDRQVDNPQLIFESMNSTGLALSKADLVRNYLLMGLSEASQQKYYKKYRGPMERKFGRNLDSFDEFMRDYLTFKSPIGQIPTFRAIYDEFKKYFIEQFELREISMSRDDFVCNLMEDICVYANYYVQLSGLSEVEDQEIREILEDMDKVKVNVTFPFLIGVYHDYKNNLLDKEHFCKILKQTENFVFRRAVCGIPTNALNKIFSQLKRYIKKTSSRDYYESFIAHLQQLETYKRVPTNEEFASSLSTKDVYNFRNKLYLLQKIERYISGKEKVQLEGLSVEHVLPQNKQLNTDWQTMLGSEWKKIQKEYVHTIGNLTLTGYNSEYSDKSFSIKKTSKGGFIESPIALSKYIAEQEQRTKNEIERRIELLVDIACKVWSFDQLDDATVAKYKMNEGEKSKEEKVYSLEEYEYLTNQTLDTFNKLYPHILSLDENIYMECKKLYIAFKLDSNFVDIIPQAQGLVIVLNVETIEHIKDPEGRCRDISGLGRWGNGNVEFKFSNNEGDYEYALSLIQQAYELQFE